MPLEYKSLLLFIVPGISALNALESADLSVVHPDRVHEIVEMVWALQSGNRVLVDTSKDDEISVPKTSWISRCLDILALIVSNCRSNCP